MHNNENCANLDKKSCSAHIAQFSKYDCLVFIIVHERIKLLGQ